MSLRCDLLRLSDLYSNWRWVRLTTLGRMINGSSSFFKRLNQGRVTIRSAEAALCWFSANWPADLDWPEEIDRPEPRRTQEAA